MEKRIRLNHRTKIPDKVVFSLSLLIGSGYLFIGIDSLLQDGRPFSGAWNTSFGLFILIYSATYFGFNLPWTPRIYISDDSIMIRLGLLSKTALYNWADISELKLGIRSVSLKIDGNYKEFKLKVSASVSKDVKRMLREVATSKSIPVVGG
ncbi:MAG: hypothetical protein AAGC88_11280 [Bacteroidota bacterium]